LFRQEKLLIFPDFYEKLRFYIKTPIVSFVILCDISLPNNYYYTALIIFFLSLVKITGTFF